MVGNTPDDLGLGNEIRTPALDAAARGRAGSSETPEKGQSGGGLRITGPSAPGNAMATSHVSNQQIPTCVQASL